MRAALVILLAMSASACGTLGGPDGGYASYDVLAQMQKDCEAKGATLKQKTEGDPRWIDGWTCERK
jgi:hypothetical protein